MDDNLLNKSHYRNFGLYSSSESLISKRRNIIDHITGSYMDLYTYRTDHKWEEVVLGDSKYRLCTGKGSQMINLFKEVNLKVNQRHFFY